MRTTELDKTEIVMLLRDMLRAHQAQGRDLEEVIAYMDKVIARRQRAQQ
jgi:hypothetical protein